MSILAAHELVELTHRSKPAWPPCRGMLWDVYPARERRIVLDRMRRRYGVNALDQLRGLPKVYRDTDACGVYFLWDHSFLVYVGKAVDIAYRLQRHLESSPFYWKFATYLAVRREFAEEVEGLYINKLKPPANRKAGRSIFLGN